ncbi:hypothetical protein [Acidisoma sp.]|uniref:hypothetical protein n=1 Tax=Acidisoma sp. TaxID=1872115 RepID=UPI003B00C538
MARSGGRAAWVLCSVVFGFRLAGVADAAPSSPPGAAPAALQCTNTTSGATWDIPVDLAHGTVDQVPAQVTDERILWEDKTLHYYDFDRRTGRLDMHVASSTGGFYLTDRCVLK